jgi:hypothetical protein
VRKEIIHVVQMMKKNNVQADQVNSTIKHILDVKEEAGETFAHLS